MESTAKKMNKEAISNFFLNYALYIIIGIIILVVVIKEPTFVDFDNFMNIIKQASTRGIMALGVAGMIVLTGTDLSAGRILGFSAAITASLVQSATYAGRMYPNLPHIPFFFVLIASILVAVAISLINGFGVAYLKMHAFIVSLGTQLIAYGATCIYVASQKNGAQPIGSFDPSFTKMITGQIPIGDFGIPYLVIYFAICTCIMWIIWNKTTFGKNMFAVGGNMEAAAVSGVNVEKTIMIVYILGGILYGISAFLEAGRLSTVDTNTGLNYELDAISGCVIGGVSFNGGVGTIPGVVIGVLLLQLINFSLYYMGVNQYLQYIIKGVIIILAVAVDVRKYLAKK